MNKKLSIVLFGASFVLMQCSNSIDSDDLNQEGVNESDENFIDLPILVSTLKCLNLSNPKEDAKKNIKNGDLRVLALRGFSFYFPGLLLEMTVKIEGHHFRIFEGTSDVIESDLHQALVEIATEYAETYNKFLMDHLRSIGVLWKSGVIE